MYLLFLICSNGISFFFFDNRYKLFIAYDVHILDQWYESFIAYDVHVLDVFIYSNIFTFLICIFLETMIRLRVIFMKNLLEISKCVSLPSCFKTLHYSDCDLERSFIKKKICTCFRKGKKSILLELFYI